jgi:hypothetical protein
MAPRRDANQPAQQPTASASASAASYSRLDKKSPRAQRSWARTLCVWGCILPLVTIALMVALPLLYKFSERTATAAPAAAPTGPPPRDMLIAAALSASLHARSRRMKTLQPGQPFSIISNQTFIAQPANVHSRFR